MIRWATGAFLAAILGTTAHAQGVPCDATRTIERNLATRWNETELFAAPSAHNPRLVVRIFVNTRTGTWTLVSTGVDGFSCMLDSGKGFNVNSDLILGEPL